MDKTLFTAAFIVLFFTSCANFVGEVNSDSNSDSNKIAINLATRILQVQNYTRMNETSFEENDTIGLFVLNQNESLSKERHIDNMAYVFNGFSFSADEQSFYPDAQQNCRFISYFPYCENGVEPESTILTVHIKPDQSTIINYSLSDFLTAKVESVKPSANAVLLDFTHRFSKINFFIEPTLEEDLEVLADNASLYIRNLYCEADYNFENDAISNLSSTNRIITNGVWNIDYNQRKVKGKKTIIIPQDCTNGQIVLKINDRTFISSFPELDLHSGVCYNVILKYDSQAGINGIAHQISDWDIDETEYESDLNEDFSNNRIIINSLNFDKTSIYNVCDENGTLMGKICKEYLLNESIDAVALVYYSEQLPLNGVVLNVLGNNALVHGGLIEWNEADNTFNYTAGEKNVIDLLYIDADGNYVEDPIDDSPALISQPYFLIDKRVTESNSYPTVKIGKQIWTRENLRTTFYADGLQIENNSSDLSRVTEGYFTSDNEIYYNYAAVLTGQLAPNGWSIPSEDAWEMLITYVNNSSSKLKSGSNWRAVDNIEASNNMTGFTGLPLGGYYSVGTPTNFVTKNYFGLYWRMNNNGVDIAELAVVLNAGANEVKSMRCYESCAYSIRLVRN